MCLSELLSSLLLHGLVCFLGSVPFRGEGYPAPFLCGLRALFHFRHIHSCSPVLRYCCQAFCSADRCTKFTFSHTNKAYIVVMKRLVTELVRLGDNKGSYRRSDSDSIEQIGGLAPTQIPKRVSTKVYSDEQLETALDLMIYNSLAELGKQDFSVFGKKQSCVQLATGCVQRLASDLLLLTDIRETIERCDLLHNRFETRRAAKIRTPNKTQSNIQTLKIY